MHLPSFLTLAMQIEELQGQSARPKYVDVHHPDHQVSSLSDFSAAAGKQSLRFFCCSSNGKTEQAPHFVLSAGSAAAPPPPPGQHVINHP